MTSKTQHPRKKGPGRRRMVSNITPNRAGAKIARKAKARVLTLKGKDRNRLPSDEE